VLKDQVQAITEGIGGARARGLAIPADDAVLFRTLLLVGRALAHLADEAIRPSGLAEAEFRVLTQLYSLPDGVGNPSELCAGSAHSPANISRITDTLVARQLISRVPSEQDRRRMILRVTAEGEALIRRFIPSAFAPIGTLFATLSHDSRAQLTAQLTEIAAAYDRLMAESTPC
jgi:MarR family transcriptional regulator, negative regulator of the multidrug operon emrRAB